jgi:hypothetical protein
MPIFIGSDAPFNPSRQRTSIVNRIVWLVGAVVIILFVLGFFGLR